MLRRRGVGCVTLHLMRMLCIHQGFDMDRILRWQERWLQPGTEYAQHAEPSSDATPGGQDAARAATGPEAGTAGANYELGIRRDYKVSAVASSSQLQESTGSRSPSPVQ